MTQSGLFGSRRISKCSSCEASIIWVKSEANRDMPLDAEPTRGLVIRKDDGMLPVAVMTDVYRSHFATCPNAAQHRSNR